jgi:1-acyl-sn-glycerol-3-phosphate acyltransferase
MRAIGLEKLKEAKIHFRSAFGYFCAVKAILAPFVLLWKIWFYVVILIVILLIFPFIWYWSRNEDDYSKFFTWSQIWARMVLIGSFLPTKVKWETRDFPDQCIIVSNHTSMLDIPFNLLLFPRPFLFIGKQELARLPLFGFFYKRTNILVDRSSMRSKKDALDKASVKIKEGYSICIYPEGGVPKHKVFLGKFKEGAFRLAKDHQLPILPITFADNKRAYPYVWNKGGPMRLRATVHKPIDIANRTTKELKEIIRTTFVEELEQYGITDEAI